MEGNRNTVPSIVVYVTVPNKEAGIESVYEWKGEIQTDAEELLIIKTRQSLLETLTEHVKANHEYDVPEVIALPITGGSQPYLEWLKSNGYYYLNKVCIFYNRSGTYRDEFYVGKTCEMMYALSFPKTCYYTIFTLLFSARHTLVLHRIVCSQLLMDIWRQQLIVVA
ncbi:protein CutA [Citrus sinensis]|uniref:Protein CutA n=1 Tax=Citrus sinensis TaxID=2711 RepID=A0ACB8KPK8_CITSI|nr:protein CutA [Citrus sinensis]